MGTVLTGILLKVILICAAPILLKGQIQLVGISPLVFIVVLVVWGSNNKNLWELNSGPPTPLRKIYAFGITSQ
jgi:hypothetical protein